MNELRLTPEEIHAGSEALAAYIKTYNKDKLITWIRDMHKAGKYQSVLKLWKDVRDEIDEIIESHLP